MLDFLTNFLILFFNQPAYLFTALIVFILGFISGLKTAFFILKHKNFKHIGFCRDDFFNLSFNIIEYRNLNGEVQISCQYLKELDICALTKKPCFKIIKKEKNALTTYFSNLINEKKESKKCKNHN